MGEIVVSSEGGFELEFQEIEMVQRAEKPNKTKVRPGDGGAAEEVAAAGGVRWERFLSKMAVRVLLVEADDSTRQVIAVLLRKCSYRVVAVADGLKAWEVLKRSPCNIDLVLTEVESPSISGYALLTLIMEHQVCKNIPVIMMSSQDSVSTVYKCMLRGAADFLIKPVRRNELSNLWQHVWRKQAARNGSGLGPPDESVQQKDETTGEDNTISDHSSGYMSCIPKNKACIEKGSDDAQSSCTKPNSDDKYRSDAIDIAENIEMQATSDVDAENTRVLENHSREAVDLIGAFDNRLKGKIGSYDSNASANKFDISPLLGMCLRRPHPSGYVDQVNDERRRLNHSDSSAFSRYINKPTLLHNQQKDQKPDFKNQSSNYAPDNHISMTTSQTRQQEITYPYSHNIPGRGLRFKNPINAYNSATPSLFRAQSGSSSPSGPHTPHHAESFPHLSTFYTSAPDQTENKPDNLDGQECISSGNDRSGNNSFDNRSKSHDKLCGDYEESLNVREGSLHRTMLREAALNKFRLKRKNRCFDKKVRYESRKKLAEQRPRVKGQFVRQPSNS